MRSTVTGSSASPHGPGAFPSESWCHLPCPGDLPFIPSVPHGQSKPLLCPALKPGGNKLF